MTTKLNPFTQIKPFFKVNSQRGSRNQCLLLLTLMGFAQNARGFDFGWAKADLQETRPIATEALRKQDKDWELWHDVQLNESF